MIFRVSKFSLFILSGFMAIIISMPSAHAALVIANNVTHSGTIPTNECSSYGVETTSNDIKNVTEAYCPKRPIAADYEITYEFWNKTIHHTMDSITIWSNGGGNYGDGELRKFDMEVDHLVVTDHDDDSSTPPIETIDTFVMTGVTLSNTTGSNDPKTVNFRADGETYDVELRGVSEIRLSKLIGENSSETEVAFREVQLNVEDADNDLVTTINLSLGSEYSIEGTSIQYEIEVTNNGIHDAYEVSLTSLLPAAYTPTVGFNGTLTTSLGSYNQTNGNVVGLVIDAESSELLILEGTIKTGQKGNTITTTTTAADNSVNDTTDTTGDILSHSVTVPDPKLTISASAVPTTNAAAGNTITYTYTVTNNGNVPLNDVGVTINSAVHNGSGPAPVAASESITPAGGTSGNSTDNGSNGTWDVLAVGDEVTFTGSYTVTQTDMDTLP